MALIKTLKNHNTFSESNYWVLSEYSHFIDQNQIRLVINWYVSEEMYRRYWVESANDTRIYILDTVKKTAKTPIFEEKEFPAVYQEENGEKHMIMPARTELVPTGKFEEVWVNEKDYVNADELIKQVVPFIYKSLSESGDFKWAKVVLS